MRKNYIIIHRLAAAVMIALPLFGDVEVKKNLGPQNQIEQSLEILSSKWVGQVPSRGRVNAPQPLTTLYPGQKFAVAIAAQGADRDRLLQAARLHVIFSVAGKQVDEENGLRPVAVRQIKADNADVMSSIFNNSGFDQTTKAAIDEASSIVSFGFFQPNWTTPVGEGNVEIQITATISGAPLAGPIAPLKINVRSASDWLKTTPPNRKELEAQINHYSEDRAPGQLLLLLKAAADEGDFSLSNIEAFFAIAYKDNPLAREAAVALFPTLDEKTQQALLITFRLDGLDLKTLFPEISRESLQAFAAVQSLSDPRVLPHYKDPVAPETIAKIGYAMDLCWSGWMASGDESYLRPLVGLLEGAPDYPDYQTWTRVRGGAQGLNAKVGRGLAYQIAGWSIGAFQRADPHVADWLSFWENDPTFPPELRKEITGLPINPAFRRK